MIFGGGENSTGEMGNFHPALTHMPFICNVQPDAWFVTLTVRVFATARILLAFWKRH